MSGCNGLGQRVGIADSLGSRAVVLADDSIDSAVLSDGTATYQHGLGLLSEVRGGSTRFYHADALGTTRDLSDASGAASAALETDAFGNAVASSGTGTPFGFAGAHGYQTDADTGWQRLGHRFYLPGLGLIFEALGRRMVPGASRPAASRLRAGPFPRLASRGSRVF
ncbi:MAG TPA: hypothetical protein VM490_24090 [Armatimonadaceae bacterium]|nr:hypothetical protein [Armatimonadaceae bacterium]